MGEVAEMMLDGTLCQHCGAFIGNGDGFPRTCHSCRGERSKSENVKASRLKVKCPDCGKLVKSIGLSNHQRDAHGIK